MLPLLFSSILATSPSQQLQINPQLLQHRWPAKWITHPVASTKEYGVFHFRKHFTLGQKPEQFLIHVSADNRYRLFVNGQFLVHGPARGDLAHWRFESVDLAPYLQAGENVLAAVVWNFGEFIPWAQMTHETAFILQGNTEAEALVNTNKDWKVTQNTAYSPLPVDSRTLHTFIVVGPGDRVEAAQYPWGWETSRFDDSAWLGARELGAGTPREMRDGGSHWMLMPRNIPFMEETLQRIPKIARTNGLQAGKDFLLGGKALTVPPRTAATMLLDQTHLTTAYPELLVSRGKGSTIKLTYAEALVDSNRDKGHRDEIANREIFGYHDEFLPDGGAQRLFRPLWFRTFRYMQIEIQTAEEPLVLHDLYGKFTGYPFEARAAFTSSEPALQNIWNVGWRTARLCAGETYYDCPYYEQLQYVGDTRIQALVSLYVSGDDRLMRNAIMQFDDSRIPDGLTASRYPSYVVQIIPPYSLFWIAMVHDYWRHREDAEFVQSFLPGIRNVIDWYERYIDDTGMLGPMPWWNFADWLDEWKGGVPPGADDGHSALITLQLIYNLDYAAELAEAFQRTAEATHYRALSLQLKQALQKSCWDESRGLFADTPEKKTFSQHVNVMAVLVALIPPNEQKAFVEKVLAEQNLSQCTFYYRFYLHQALKKAGLSDRYLEMLDPWHDMLKLGLTTFAEKPEPTRSDCHAWSASPNYDLLATVCGIEPDAPGFASVRIASHLGSLQWIKARMPHPRGEIVIDLSRKGASDIAGEITLPEGVSGKFLWNGKAQMLKAGKQKVAI
ncbi:alpha-L-rhamnosidase [candidate division KSB1 bacterium]|nr:alpha-L-rhamnosidase [candidate division KSB1 bacterium]